VRDGARCMLTPRPTLDQKEFVKDYVMCVCVMHMLRCMGMLHTHTHTKLHFEILTHAAYLHRTSSPKVYTLRSTQ